MGGSCGPQPRGSPDNAVSKANPGCSRAVAGALCNRLSRIDGVLSEEKMVLKENRRSLRSPAEKLMRDAIAAGKPRERSSGDPDEASGSGSHGQAMDGSGEWTSASPLGAAATAEGTKAAARCRFEFGDNQVSDALLAGLAEVGASAPWFVDRKELTSTDARVDQSRLQMSSKSPISTVFTSAERAGTRTADGLSVPAFDRRGQRYVLKCKLSNGKNYRFMGAGWTEFMQDHGLLIAAKAWINRRVTVELWPFRSRALPKPEGNIERSGHPDGALGLVVLHRVHGEGGEQQAPEAAAVPPDEEAEMENAGEEEQAAAVAVQEEAPADDAYAELGQGEAPGAEAVVAQVQGEATMEHGEAGGYNHDELMLEQIAGTMLFVLRTSNRRKRKRNDDRRAPD